MAAGRARAIAAVALVATVAGCGGSQAAGQPSLPPEGPAGRGYTAVQLQQALLPQLPGYQRAGEPEYGEYGSLKTVQTFEESRRAVTYDKPECATSGQAVGSTKEIANAPAAMVTFTKEYGQTVTVTLMAVSPDLAAKKLKFRVPPECRTFRSKAGGKQSTNRVVEATTGQLGQGSRTVGVATTTGSVNVKTWFVVLCSHGYLATITVFGPDATRAEAEQLAGQAYQQAERILP